MQKSYTTEITLAVLLEAAKTPTPSYFSYAKYKDKNYKTTEVTLGTAASRAFYRVPYMLGHNRPALGPLGG